MLVERPRRAVALVAPHHQPSALLPEIDEQVRVAKRRQMESVPVYPALAKRLGHEVLVGKRNHRHPHPSHPADLGRKHPAGVDHDLGLDIAPLGAHAADPTTVDVDGAHARVGEHPAAALAGAVNERVGQLRGVEIAVGREVGRAPDAIADHQREQLLSLFGREQLERQTERLRPRDLSHHLLLALGSAGESDPPALHPAAIEPPVELDRVHHHPRQRDASAQLPDKSRRVECRPAGQLVSIDEDHVALAKLG